MGRLGAALQSECLLSGNCWDSVELNTAVAGWEEAALCQSVDIIVSNNNNNNSTNRIFIQNFISLYFLIPQIERDPVWINLAKKAISEFDLTPNIQSEKVHNLSIMFFLNL